MILRILRLVALVLLAAAAGYGLWHSAHREAGMTVDGIAAQLQCPACDGESVAQSRSPLAAAMRDSIRQQLAQGRSPAQIRSWFVGRYGPQVLADPPATGTRGLLWAVPAICASAAGGLALRALSRRDRGRTADAEHHRPSRRAASAIWFGSAAALAASVLTIAGGAALTRPPPAGVPDRQAQLLALARMLDNRQQYSAAVDVYRDLLAADPDDSVRLSLALDLLRSGQPAAAQQIAAELAQHDPQWAEPLLILGLAQRAEHSPAADATLRRFLRLAPQHAAAPQVRRLLADPALTPR
jgi:cytochrome c-type biogenesis protein CcmH/NrfF